MLAIVLAIFSLANRQVDNTLHDYTLTLLKLLFSDENGQSFSFYQFSYYIFHSGLILQGKISPLN